MIDLPRTRRRKPN